MKLVTAILPTRGRVELARQAVDCFVRQTYCEKELLIYDDLEDPSFPEGIVIPGQRIMRFMGHARSIPQKRNELCDLARGEIVMHFDSDDWSSPDRMADQVERLTASGKPVTGYHSMLFFNGTDVYKYFGAPNYALGTSLCYLKSWWVANRFPEDLKDAWGEDNAFVRAAAGCDKLSAVDAVAFLVARAHDGNTSRKHFEGYQFRRLTLDDLPQEFPH